MKCVRRGSAFPAAFLTNADYAGIIVNEGAALAATSESKSVICRAYPRRGLQAVGRANLRKAGNHRLMYIRN